MPYPITYTYQGGTPTSDNAAAALKAGWDKAGFSVKLAPLTDTYYDVIQNPSNNTFDVTEGGWGADYPSIFTVLPALFDSRINLTAKSNGQDYGNYKNPEAEKLMDEAAAAPEPGRRECQVAGARRVPRQGRCLHPELHPELLLPAWFWCRATTTRTRRSACSRTSASSASASPEQLRA